MNVAFSVRAELDLTDILDDLAAANPSAAYQLNSQLTQRINNCPGCFEWVGPAMISKKDYVDCSFDRTCFFIASKSMKS